MTTPRDPYSKYLMGWDAPMERSEAADYSSADHDFTFVTRAILVLGSGTVVVRLQHDGADLSLAVSGDIFLPLRATNVRQTTTGVTAVIGFA